MNTAPIIIGVDESGCGSLAGPLIVAATAFRREDSAVTASYQGARGMKVLVAGDSKSYKNPEHRNVLEEAIRGAALGYVLIERSNLEIDEKLLSRVFPESIGLAASRMIEQLITKGFPSDPRYYTIMVDGEVEVPEKTMREMDVRKFVDGDKHIWQIGAASILAKVECDRKILQLHQKYPMYEFEQNKGYPTKRHKELLKEHGPCEVHRHTFRPVATCQGLKPGFEFR